MIYLCHVKKVTVNLLDTFLALSFFVIVVVPVLSCYCFVLFVLKDFHF